ncbi:MAG: hypothetical protein HWN68_07410 [Desulfobacterales bacterium]|nr:hypothetical protein [Desulfobacterales bacterium]
MNVISEELVEETWQEVAGFSPDLSSAEMTKFCGKQPELVAFVVEFLEDSDQQLREFATYMLFVVYRMFEKNTTKEIRKISAEEIIKYYDSNEDLVANLEGVDDRFLNRIAKVQLAGQPYVMKYVLEVLMDIPEEEKEEEEKQLVAMRDDDIGYLFLLLKTVVDVLDYATQSDQKWMT